MNKQQLIAYPQGTTEPLIYPTGEVVLDLFKDEPIPLVLTADDFTNTAERDSSHSDSFDIPGTKNNNLFFNHIYDITSDSNFNPHIRTKIVVKEGRINTIEGYLQLNDILVKDGAISYNITIYDNVANLKAILEEKIFRDLDFTELTHDYNQNNIINSWTGVLDLQSTLPANSFAGTGTTTDVVKYPMIQWNQQVSYTSTTITTPEKNDLFRPFVKLKYILQNMLRDAEYSVDFDFNTPADFDGLYADFNKGWGEGTWSFDTFVCTNTSNINYTTTAILDFNTIDNAANIVGTNYFDTATDVFTAIDNSLVVVTTNLKKVSGSNGLIYLYKNGTLIFTQNWTTNQVQFSQTIFGLVAGDTLEVHLSPTGTINLDKDSFVRFSVQPNTNFIQDTLIGYKGDTNQWDFFKDIINTFNLVILTDSNNPKNLTILPYNDWIDTGNEIDLTNNIIDDKVKYETIQGLAKNTIFKFVEDDKDLITELHNNPNEWRYSHNERSDIEIFDKDENLVELKEIAATYYAPAFNGSVFIPKILDIANTKNWKNKWRILYDNGVETISSTTITSYNFTANSYLRFSSKQDGGISYNYGVVNYDYSGAWIDSLYNTYWLRYLDELYHKDTRTLIVEAIITSDLISTIKFNDIILIKNKKFRITKINYRAGSISKLELITIKDL